VYRGYWIDIGTPGKYLQVHRDIMSGQFPAVPFVGAPANHAAANGAHIEAGATVAGPCFLDEGVTIKGGATIGPGTVLGRNTIVEDGARVSGSIVWANGWVGKDAQITDAILGRNCHVGRSVVVGPGAVLGDKTLITDFSSL
jgi:NDP-sugar pyrophosphorylase family protein